MNNSIRVKQYVRRAIYYNHEDTINKLQNVWKSDSLIYGFDVLMLYLTQVKYGLYISVNILIHLFQDF